MLEFAVNPVRLDPYKNFKFRIKWDGRYVAGISRVSALSRTTEVIVHQENGEPNIDRKTGQTTFEPIILEGGVTYDRAFAAWTSKVWDRGAEPGDKVAPSDIRKDIILELANEAGRLVLAYKIFGCRVSEYNVLPALDANGNAIAIEHIALENEGWERDTNPPSVPQIDALEPQANV